MNKFVLQDVREFVSFFAFSKELKGSTFLITGASGLIGSHLILCLLSIDSKIRIIAPVRNKQKTIDVLQGYSEKIELIECDLMDFNYDSLAGIDYIIHCAAPTSSKFFVDKPVETFEIIYHGTSNLLKFAQKKKVKGFVYLSSLEVYGCILDDSTSLIEEKQGYLDLMSTRSSYPMAKRATENLCHLYAKEYGVPVKVARLTQTTGPGISKDDNRIIASFARLASQGFDIVLHTTGESARPYCYLNDCVSAILHILLKGESGEAYNVANESTYISAREMAFFLKDNINPNIQVKIDIADGMGYAPITKQKLSTKKLQGLGWTPRYGLKEIFERLCSYLKDV